MWCLSTSVGLLFLISLFLLSFSSQSSEDSYPKQFDDAELRERLTPLQYDVTQKEVTERAFTGKYYAHDATGNYKCVVCKEDLFRSNMKYDSGSGWPSFFDTINKRNVKLIEDYSHSMRRTEVLCAKCGAHLGHLFDDGPQPTGKRFCMNSASLDFEASKTDL